VPEQGPVEEARRQHLLQTQAAVEQATKLLMARFACGPDMAFELLLGASQYANVKVHVVAEQLIEQRWANDQENPR
jgi:AmiR/NasT family two-component response regulator